MCINNRGLALVYRLIAFILGSLAIFFDFGLFEGEFKKGNFLYFTIISNIVCVIFFGILLIKTIYDIRNNGIYGSSNVLFHIRGEILISILLTMSVYHFILIPYALNINPYQSLKLVDIFFHYVMPMLTLFDWILFDEKGKFKWYDPLIWTIGPYVYLVVIFIQSGMNNIARVEANIGKYVYAFLDVDVIGISNVTINILCLTIAFIVIGYLIYGFDKIKISD